MNNPMQPFSSPLKVLHARSIMSAVVFFLFYFVNSVQGIITPSDAYTITPIDNAELWCRSTPKPAMKNYIQWFKEGVEVKTDYGKYDLGNNTESLEIIHVDELDVGEYVCRDMVSGETSKAFIRAGAWSLNGNDMVKNQGDTITVDCHAWGYPTPDIRWYKDGQELKADGTHYVFEDRQTLQKNISLTNGRLRINKATLSDTGKYKCEASNLTNKHSASTSVRVKDPLSYVWPALGIVLLLAILAVGIGLFLFFRNKYMKKEKARKAKWRKLEAERRQRQQPDLPQGTVVIVKQ